MQRTFFLGWKMDLSCSLPSFPWCPGSSSTPQLLLPTQRQGFNPFLVCGFRLFLPLKSEKWKDVRAVKKISINQTGLTLERSSLILLLGKWVVNYFFICMRLSRQTRLPLRMHNVYCTSTGSGKMEKLCLGHCALTSNSTLKGTNALNVLPQPFSLIFCYNFSFSSYV